MQDSILRMGGLPRFSPVFVGLTAAALLLAQTWPAAAQTDRVSGEARRFLVYPVADLIDFAEREEGQFGLSYQVRPTKDMSHYFNVNVVRFADAKQAVSGCNELANWSRGDGYQVSIIGGYACAFVAEKRRQDKDGDGKAFTVQIRTTAYVVGAYMGSLAEAAVPPRTEAAPIGPLLAALNGGQPLSSQEVAFRNLLFPALGFSGDTARSCLDEVMNWAEAQTDKTTRDQIAQLRKAGTAASTVEVLAADTARPEDFDSQWWDALREVVPDPSTAKNPGETATDFLIDLLPPPLNTLVNFGRNTHKGLQAAKTHITDPKMRGEIYACYHREHFGRVFGDGVSAGAYEDELSQNLANATVCGKAGEMFKSSYEKQLSGLSGEEREREFRRLITPVAIRFEYIYRVEDARANRATRLAEAWAPVQNILDRLKTRVNACIAKPR
jgi:hypothetical protein